MEMNKLCFYVYLNIRCDITELIQLLDTKSWNKKHTVDVFANLLPQQMSGVTILRKPHCGDIPTPTNIISNSWVPEAIWV